MSRIQNVDLCISMNGKYYKITIPKTWLKKNRQRQWQNVLPENVMSIRIAEMLHGINVDELELYPIDKYLTELFENY